jgi:hypothetical protein
MEWDDEPRPVRTILMSRTAMELSPERAPLPQFGEDEQRKLASLFQLWRERSELEAGEEREFAVLLRELVKSRAAETLELDVFLRLVGPFAGEAALGDEKQQLLIRRVKPLLRTRS